MYSFCKYFQNQEMVKEYCRMKESNKSQFTGVRMNYHVWRRRFIATFHSQQRLISDKGKALSNAIYKRKRLMGDRILVLHYDSQTYAFLVAEVRRLYRGAKQKIVTTALDLFDGSKLLLLSLESVRVFREKLEAYRTTLETYCIRALLAASAAKFNIAPVRWQDPSHVAIVPTESKGKT
jgi:hypothetical protein